MDERRNWSRVFSNALGNQSNSESFRYFIVKGEYGTDQYILKPGGSEVAHPVVAARFAQADPWENPYWKTTDEVTIHDPMQICCAISGETIQARYSIEAGRWEVVNPFGMLRYAQVDQGELVDGASANVKLYSRNGSTLGATAPTVVAHNDSIHSENIENDTKVLIQYMQGQEIFDPDTVDALGGRFQVVDWPCQDTPPA